MSKRSRFPEFRAELRQREEHSREIGRRIRATSGENRTRLWEQKRAYGRSTRHCLLLLAFLRGKPRTWCEPAWDANYTPYLAYYVADEAKRFGIALDVKMIRAWLESAPAAAQHPVTEAPSAEALPDSPS